MKDAASLDEILDGAWAMLARGAADPRDDCHWPVLATVSAHPEGARPSARTVVLRRCSREARALEVHSDARAAKLAELAREPNACLVFHHGRHRTQLRVLARASLHAGDEPARRAWQHLALTSRRQYCASLAPGSEADGPVDGLPEGLPPVDDASAADYEPGFANFAAIELALTSIDWLLLGRDGHRRARFDWNGERFEGRWLAP